MESGMIFISITLITICALPFILMNISAKKHEKILKSALQTAITKKNGQLTDYEIHNNYALGIDAIAQQLYFYKKTKDNSLLKTINLHQVKACEIKKDLHNTIHNKASYEITQRLKLSFIATGNGNTQEIELFNYDESTQLNGEIALAERWKAKVDVLLSDNSSSYSSPNTILEFA